MNTSKHPLETGLKVLPVVMVMLALAGCAGTHVGDDWQCPLAQGEVCASVSAADPAVLASVEREGSQLPAENVPLYRPSELYGPPIAREDENATADAEKVCGRGFGLLLPFAWLGRLLAPDAHASVDPASRPGAEPVVSPRSRTVTDHAGEADPPSAEVVTRVTRHPAHDDAREPERIGRVWIGPFVDADGVYREASWVRIVIAPAEWRIP